MTALRWSIHTGIIIVLRALWPEVDAPARGIIDHALFFSRTRVCVCAVTGVCDLKIAELVVIGTVKSREAALKVLVVYHGAPSC